MKQQELQDQIKGYSLLGHFLQAFLVQTAYLEGLIKLLTDFTHFIEIERRSNAAAEVYQSKFIKCVQKDIKRQSVSRSIGLLKDSETISEQLAKDLLDYFRVRNEIIHDLINQMDSTSFMERLRVAVERGDVIMKDSSFDKMIKLAESREKMKLEPSTSPSVNSSTPGQ